jgi:hypothetical protein
MTSWISLKEPPLTFFWYGSHARHCLEADKGGLVLARGEALHGPANLMINLEANGRTFGRELL